MWSEWTQCDKFCNGTQFRRKLCICGDDLSCSENYDDSLCAGVPETEVRTCNVLDSCCTWNFTDNWSECMTDNHCCGNGIQWRRQVCLCNDEESDDVSGCLLSGQLPLTETRECSMSDCCQFGPATPISCDQLMKSNRQASDLCITSWKQRDCLCPSGIDGELEPGNFTQCAWDSMIFDNPPISFDRSQDYCLTPDQPDGTVDCNEFLSNGTCAAYTFEFGAGAVISVSDISTGDCHYSDTNCWDGWSDWSPCCGTCDEAYQWRIQTTSTGLNSCRQPPQFEFQNCTIENCCFWTYDDTVEWSSCSVLIGDGFQSRFPYNCSCDDLTLCPVPPDYEIQSCFNETQSCTWIDFSGATSCDNDSAQQWYSQQCSCISELGDTVSSSCDIANCFGTPNMTTSNCTSENKEEENTSYGPCEWIEIVSDCEGECTYRLGEYEEEAVDEVSERKRHHDDSGNMIGNGNNGNNGNGNCNGKIAMINLAINSLTVENTLTVVNLKMEHLKTVITNSLATNSPIIINIITNSPEISKLTVENTLTVVNLKMEHLKTVITNSPILNNLESKLTVENTLIVVNLKTDPHLTVKINSLKIINQTMKPLDLFNWFSLLVK
jgi:hypothetical protein